MKSKMSLDTIWYKHDDVIQLPSRLDLHNIEDLELVQPYVANTSDQISNMYVCSYVKIFVTADTYKTACLQALNEVCVSSCTFINSSFYPRYPSLTAVHTLPES